MRLVYTLAQAAQEIGTSRERIRKAVYQDYTPGETRDPRLTAHRLRARGQGDQAIILSADLTAWVKQLGEI